jgi:hypothetical protein
MKKIWGCSFERWPHQRDWESVGQMLFFLANGGGIVELYFLPQTTFYPCCHSGSYGRNFSGLKTRCGGTPMQGIPPLGRHPAVGRQETGSTPTQDS